jgi:hypothetical protein
VIKNKAIRKIEGVEKIRLKTKNTPAIAVAGAY